MLVSELHPGIFGDQFARDPQRARTVSALVKVHGPVDLPVDGDQVLGVVRRSVRRLGGSRAGEVAEAPQLGGLVGVCGPGLDRSCRKPQELGAQLAQRREALVGEIVQFGRIPRQVVVLGNRKLDVFLPFLQDPAQRCPAPGEARRKGFEVRGSRAGVRPVGQERSSRELSVRPVADGIQDRREDVDVPGERRVASLPGKVPRPQKQRHVERRLVREEPVGFLAVLAARFAVVGRHDEERWRRVCGADRVEERRESRIRERDVAQIEVVRESLAELGWRVVGSVRVVNVNPQKAGPARLPAVPVERRRDDRRTGALLDAEVRGVLRLAVNHVVHVEPAGEAVPRVQRKGRHEGAGRVSHPVKDRRRRRESIVEAEARVVPHAVLEGIEPRQDVDVRWERQDVLPVGEREDETVGRDGVEVRRRASRVPAEPDGVRAAGVDRHEDDVADPGSRRHRVGTGAAPQDGAHGEGREEENAIHPGEE